MAAYNVFLVDILNLIGSDGRRVEVKATLQGYFDSIVKKAGVDGGVVVSFVMDDPQAKPSELIAYYSTAGWHVVTEMDGGKVPADSEGGLTLWNGKVTASDVVADGKSETKLIANLTFHELMHNKLGMGDEMHRLGGLAVGTVSAEMRPSADNIQRMGGALNVERPQWTGGFAQLRDRNKPVAL